MKDFFSTGIFGSTTSRLWLGGLLLWGGMLCGMLVLDRGYSVLSIVFHAIFLLGIGGAVGKIEEWNSQIGAWIGRLIVLGLMVVYLYAVLANHLWGRFLSWQMIILSWGEWRALWEAIGLCENWIMGGIAGIVIGGFLLIWTFGGKAKTERRNGKRWVLGIWILCLMPWGYKLGEPVSNTLRPRVYPPFPQTAEVFLDAVEDAKGRKTYKSGKPVLQKHIILILIDALRADHLSMYGYERNTTPFLAALKSEGNLQQVEWTFTSCSHSTCGIASTLNARNTCHQGLSHFSLHHLLHQQGYQVNFFLSGVHHPFYYLDKAHAQQIDRFQDGFSSERKRQYEDDLILEELDRLTLQDLAEQPQFLYLHLMSAHSNRVLDTAYQHFQPTQEMKDWGHKDRGVYDHAAITNTYDNGILQADAYLKDIWQRLEGLGLLEDALVIISGDHGEGLGEHGYYGHRYHLYPEGVRVPLLVYDSDSTQLVNQFFARQIDIAPTIVDRLGLPIPAKWEGKSLYAPLPTESKALMQTVDQPGWIGEVVQQDSVVIQHLTNTQTGEEIQIPLSNH